MSRLITAKEARSISWSANRRAKKKVLEAVPAILKRIHREISHAAALGNMEVVVQIRPALAYEPVVDALTRQGYRCYWHPGPHPNVYTESRVSWEREP